MLEQVSSVAIQVAIPEFMRDKLLRTKEKKFGEEIDK